MHLRRTTVNENGKSYYFQRSNLVAVASIIHINLLVVYKVES